MNKLSERQVQTLIDLVQAKPELYNKAHNYYNKLEQKERIWKDIAYTICAEERDCKAAWRCLKDQFVRRFKEYKGRTGRSANEMCKRYKNFERLMFLKDAFEPGSSVDGSFPPTEFLDVDSTSVPFPKTSPTSNCSENIWSTVPEWLSDTSSPSAKRVKQSLPEKSPILINEAPDWQSDASSSASKNHKASMDVELSGFLKRLKNQLDCREPDNVETFFQSIAKSAKAFNLTTIETSKLMLGTTELLHNIVANRQQQVSQQSSQWSQNIVIETGHHQDQLNTRNTINVIVNNNKKERQKRYREQNREKLKQLEAERRTRIRYLQSTAGPSTNLNNEETIASISQSSSGLENTRTASNQTNEQGNEINALLKKRNRQQRYREQNRDKLKQREAERRRRQQNAEMITEVSN